MASATLQPTPPAEPAKHGLPLPSLQVRGYRLFEDLTLPRLARVNLITGRNNSGKTALLEAIRIWADTGAPRTLRNIIERRGDGQGGYLRQPDVITTWAKLGVESLFLGHPPSLREAEEIEIGLADSDLKTVYICAGTYDPIPDDDGLSWFIPNSPREMPVDRSLALALTIGGSRPEDDPGWDIRTPAAFVDATSPERLSPGGPFCEPIIYSSASGLGQKERERLWDTISLTSGEEDVVEIVRIVVPSVERINLRAVDYGQGRLTFARVTGVAQPIPLARLGDGVNRAFELGLGMVNARNGCLLLDEVENGIHYSVQPELWRMIFATAQRLNVQVFATTHSYDCFRGFQQAASENKEVEGKLIRLVEHEGKIVPTEFTARDLEIVTEQQLEVR